MKNRLLRACSAIVLSMFCGAAVSAIIIDEGPAWPGSADTSSYSFNFISPTNNSVLYPNIADSNVANLYFGVAESFGDVWGYSMDIDRTITPAEEMTWFADTANSIEYRGATQISLQGVMATYNYRYLLTAISGATVISDTTTTGLGNDVHSLFQVDLTPGSQFNIARQFQVEAQYGWVDANSFFDDAFGFTNLQKDRCDQCSVSSVATGFYSESLAEVSEPSIFIIMSLCVLGLVARTRAIKFEGQ